MPDSDRGLRSLLIPIHGDALLLPTAVVAEVADFVEPEPVPNTPDWLLGYIAWREHKLPVICMKTAMTNEAPAVYGHRAKVIVFYNLEKSAQLPFYGVVSTGIPKACLASRDNIQTLAKNDAQSYVLQRVEVQLQGKAVIPDLDGIQNALLAMQSN